MSLKSDRIAICGELIPSSLKHRLLFFDYVAVFDLDWMIKRLHKSNATIAISNDLEFLQSKDLLYDLKHPNFIASEGPFNSEETSLSFIWNAIVEKIERQKKKGIKRFSPDPDLMDAAVLYHARLWADAICKAHEHELDASVVRSNQLTIPRRIHKKIQLRRTNIIDVVLDKLPMPSEETPWEAILDFKADTGAQGYLQGLKVWMSDVTRQKFTATDASEKLEWLLFQHKKHLEMHKLSYRWGTLGGTFVAAAEILEDLAKIKWGKAAGAVVSIFDRRLELLKSELDNPAKEVSYIIKAQEQFGQ